MGDIRAYERFRNNRSEEYNYGGFICGREYTDMCNRPFLQKPKEFNKRKGSLNAESVAFFAKYLQELKDEADKGNILFFRKYGYEKILNMYLSQTYGIANPGMELFSSERKVKKREGGEKITWSKSIPV